MNTENLNTEITKEIFEIAKKSPEHGNALMDILGETLYDKIAKLANSR